MESYAMNYSVRKATSGDIASLVRLADLSRQTMKRTGNASQWANGYPSESIFREDIASNDCYLVLSGRVAVGAFVLRKGPDPTYAEIFQGQWLDTAPYSVIHRVIPIITVCSVASSVSAGNNAPISALTHTGTMPSCATLCRSTGSLIAASST